ncbi:MAG: GatB/YqeY domain-containing protein [Patescibacteria group bacterium]
MLPIEQRLETECRTQALAKSPELGILRLLKNALQQAQITARGTGKELTEADGMQVLRKEYKKRIEAAEMYEKAGRPELAIKEKAEAEIVLRYLPPAPNEEQVLIKAKELALSLNLSGQSSIGKLTKALIEDFGSGLDGQMASRVAKQVLGV